MGLERQHTSCRPCPRLSWAEGWWWVAGTTKCAVLWTNSLLEDVNTHLCNNIYNILPLSFPKLNQVSLNKQTFIHFVTIMVTIHMYLLDSSILSTMLSTDTLLQRNIHFSPDTALLLLLVHCHSTSMYYVLVYSLTPVVVYSNWSGSVNTCSLRHLKWVSECVCVSPHLAHGSCSAPILGSAEHPGSATHSLSSGGSWEQAWTGPLATLHVCGKSLH